MSNICWFQLLKYNDLLLFFAIHGSKWRVFGFCTKSYCDFCFFKADIMIGIWSMISGNDNFCIPVFIFPDSNYKIMMIRFVTQDISATLQYFIIMLFYQDFFLNKKLHPLWFGYCTWPYCSFGNISINCAVLVTALVVSKPTIRLFKVINDKSAFRMQKFKYRECRCKNRLLLL